MKETPQPKAIQRQIQRQSHRQSKNIGRIQRESTRGAPLLGACGALEPRFPLKAIQPKGGVQEG